MPHWATISHEPLALFTFAEARVLLAWWKPLILLLPLIAYLWLVSTVFDKHAARFHLGRHGWNVAHLVVALVAVVLAFALPIESQVGFWAGLGLMCLLLGAQVAVFVTVVNRDERVPERHRLRLDLSALREARAARAAARLQGRVELAIRGPDGQILQAPEKDSPEFALRIAAESLFLRARDARALQIDLAPTGKDSLYGVSMLVDGVRRVAQTLPESDAIRLIDFWKHAAGLDLADRRRRLSADLTIDRGEARHLVRLETSGSAQGMRLSLTIDPHLAVRLGVDQLGLLEPQRKELDAIVAERQGVVLLAGLPHGGRTTTLYAIIKMHDAYTSNVQTLEFSPQDTLEGVRQNRYDRYAQGPEFSTMLRSILRRDPDVVGVAELPDAATAREAARADHDRTRVYLSLRADSALAAIKTWVNAVGDVAAAAEALHGVLAQRLLRRLCLNCRVPYQPAPDMLAKLGLPPDKVKQLYKRGGQVLIRNKPDVCPVCGGIGYFEQTGVFEVFGIGPAERELIQAGNLVALRAEFRKRMLPTLQQAALRKAIEGITSVEEVMRVTVEAKAAGAGGAAA